VACPDLFLLDAPDPTTREGLIANVLRQVAERGKTALALSPDAAAADRIVELTAVEKSLRIVRALGNDENAIRPSPSVTRQTSQAQGSARAEQLKREAALTISALEARLARFDRSRSLRKRLEEAERQRDAMLARIAAIEGEVRAESSGMLREIHARREAALSPKTAESAVLRGKRTEKEAALAAAERQFAEASHKPGFFARLFGGSQPAANLKVCETTIASLKRQVNECKDEEATLRAEVESIERGFAEEIEKAIAAEVALRRPKLEPILQNHIDEATGLEKQLRDLHPQATVDDTVENGTLASHSRAELERELTVGRTRLEELRLAGADLPRRLLAETAIVVGTPGSLDTDPVFRALPQPLDVLILDHAEELTETHFARLSLLAKRWILAGDAASKTPLTNGTSHRRRLPESTLLARLGQRLDGEPWVFEHDRLVLRLVHLQAEKRASLSREPVLDHPHVELRLTAGDGEEPVLAEIAFPAETTVVQAKQFLFSQLGEVLLRPGGNHHWHKTDDRLTVCWPMLDESEGEWVELELGVRERVVGCGCGAFTAAIAFETASGWNDDTAREWLAEHIPAPSSSRLAIIRADKTHSLVPSSR